MRKEKFFNNERERCENGIVDIVSEKIDNEKNEFDDKKIIIPNDKHIEANIGLDNPTFLTERLWFSILFFFFIFLYTIQFIFNF